MSIIQVASLFDFESLAPSPSSSAFSPYLSYHLHSSARKVRVCLQGISAQYSASGKVSWVS